MIDLSAAASGEIGAGVFFSELFARAIETKFTGAVLLRAAQEVVEGAEPRPPEDRAVFFREGKVVHAGGSGFSDAYLGQILIESDGLAPDALQAALDEQAQAEGVRPLLGALLVRSAGIDPGRVKSAVVQQAETRALALFGATQGTWLSAPGENGRVRDIGLPTGSIAWLYQGIRDHVSDVELRNVTDQLLGKAVQLHGPVNDLNIEGEHEAKILKYLEKPRKPDQLERAVSQRRLVRVVLRTLMLADRVRIVPAAQGIPIPKATIIGSGGVDISLLGGDPAASVAPTKEEPVAEAAQGAGEAPGRASSSSRRTEKLVNDFRSFYDGLAEKNYYEILSVSQQVNAVDLRKAFTVLAKKYHPDLLGTEVPQDVAILVQHVASRINEAYNTLSNEKTRAEYLALLSDQRIKGDARKAEKIKDASVKHQMAVVLLKRKEYQKAREYLTYAVQADPDSADYKAALAWSMFSDSQYDRKEATDKAFALLTEALKNKRPSADMHFYMGQVLKAKRDIEQSLHHFQRALERDPKHTEAASEIRLLERRREKSGPSNKETPKETGEKKAGGFLNKLFKK